MKSMTIKEFNEYLETKKNNQLKRDLLVFTIFNLILVGGIEVITTSEKVVEGAEFFLK